MEHYHLIAIEMFEKGKRKKKKKANKPEVHPKRLSVVSLVRRLSRSMKVWNIYKVAF